MNQLHCAKITPQAPFRWHWRHCCGYKFFLADDLMSLSKQYPLGWFSLSFLSGVWNPALEEANVMPHWRSETIEWFSPDLSRRLRCLWPFQSVCLISWDHSTCIILEWQPRSTFLLRIASKDLALLFLLDRMLKLCSKLSNLSFYNSRGQLWGCS